MKNYSTKLFWVLTDALIILAIPFFPSLFSIFCILAAIVFAPIEEWQDIINKYLKKPIKSSIIAVLIAFVIALFPISPIVAGIYNLATPENVSSNNTSSVIYYEAPASDVSFEVSDEVSETENTYSEFITTSDMQESSTVSKNTNVTSSKTIYNSSTSKPTFNSSKTSKSNSSSIDRPEITNSIPSNSNLVYRTPSGKRYHNSASCGGKNSFSVSYEDAINDGLTPCKKCVK